ncbi:histidine phosphatase family protein [Fimbriiglobus ruber]|uniref:Flagellar basal body-associated protein FliL n=1 Tax=Fimbriiglobus ruber TaxID=1908690 RepID=A0A225D915_9BACT|nr:histidine phosphatase family protein [Fimbriiglobus ruber]OWK35028.1 hypothetical protein FRUB_09870 [Fimbriiglobus ruber]
MIARFVVVVLVLVLASYSGTAGAQNAAKAHPSVVLVIRHAEKPPADDMSVDLNAAGKARAKNLFKLFEKSPSRPDPFPKPDFIFATKNSKNSHRPVETVTPLSEKLRLPIEHQSKNEGFAQLANELFGQAKYSGKIVLICWHHGEMPDLVTSLKAEPVPPKLKPAVFDRVWQIRYDAKGNGKLTDLPQHLMPDDSDK